MIIGYTAGEGDDTEIIDLLDDIGYCCGYIFQSLNDLEPFGNGKELMNHKGALTTDVLKNRKNIVVAYIYAWANKSETENLLNLNDSNCITENINSLINKYHIKEHILDTAIGVIILIILLILLLPQAKKERYVSILRSFKSAKIEIMTDEKSVIETINGSIQV